MAVLCPNCGAQNPDGNNFCQTCGQPLPAAGGAVPPGGTLPPGGAVPPGGAPPAGSLPPAGGVPPGAGAPPPPSAPPYLSSGGGAAPQHRIPLLGIVGAVIGAIILLSLAAAVVHAVSNSANPTPIAVQTPTPLVPPTIPAAAGTPPVAATPTSQPVLGGGTSTPPPAVTPTPASQATSSCTFQTRSWCAAVPGSWTTIKSDDTSATFEDPNSTGVLTIQAFQLSQQTSVQQAVQSIEQSVQRQYPDARDCGNGAQNVRFGMPPESGADVILCYTYTPQNGGAYPAADEFLVAVNTGGSVGYSIELYTPQEKHQEFVAEAIPIIKSIQWSLT